MGTNIIFQEEQKFASWLRWLIYISMGAAALLSLFALKKEFTEQSSPEINEIILAVALGIAVPIGIAVLFVFLKLQTQVRSDGLYIRFSPFHIRFKRFSPQDLSRFYTRQYKPIQEYGGWGIRCGWAGKGRAYNVSGNEGVQLELKDGKKILIGSQRAQELEQAIHSITS